MRENGEPLFDPGSMRFRDALMACICQHKRIGREQLLDLVFRAYDGALTELIRSGEVAVERAPHNESHMDILVAVHSDAR